MMHDRVQAHAHISECGTYRYYLSRKWDASLPQMVWLMLNPSTADAAVDDPTIRKCMGFARRNGCGGISVYNLFALRATNPKELLTHPDPVGPHNNGWLVDMGMTWGMPWPQVGIVCAWGNLPSKKLSERVNVVQEKIAAVVPRVCLGTTKDGQPRHPSRIAYATPLVPFGDK